MYKVYSHSFCKFEMLSFEMKNLIQIIYSAVEIKIPISIKKWFSFFPIQAF